MSKTAVAIRHVGFEDVGVWRAILIDEGYELLYVEAGIDDLREPALENADLAIVLGGPIGVYESDRYPFLADEMRFVRSRLAAQKPLLGVCLGAQVIAAALGAGVAPGPGKEIGYGPVTLTEAGRASALRRLEALPVLHWHGDNLELPVGAERLASTSLCPNQAFRIGDRVLALQFHVEADPRTLETWLIGNATELAAAGIDPRALRADAARLGAATAAAGQAMFAEWLRSLAS